MSNPWNIPAELEKKVRERDKLCVYCGIPMKAHLHSKGTPGDKATWEHIDNNEKNVSAGNIALCCGSCNSSKRETKLSVWLKSEYCKEKNVADKMAPIIRRYILKK